MDQSKGCAGYAYRRPSWYFAVILVSGLVAASVDAAYVITKQGTKVEGTDIRARANGEIVLTTPQGSRTFYPGQYLKAVADRPAEYDQAQRLIAQGKYADAVESLKGIVERYRYLEWDQQARALLAKAYAGLGQHEKAVETFEEMFRIDPELAKNSELQWSFRAELLAAGRYAELSRALQDVISSGSREDAARAYVMRGDLALARNQVEAAALDYLRAVILFQDQPAVQPEALYKAAEALEKLRDARAKELYEELVTKYPSSPYAQQARQKI